MSLTVKRIKQLMDYDVLNGGFVRKLSRGRYKKGSVVGGIVQGNATNQYMRTTIDKKRYIVHRLVWLHMTGTMPSSDMDIDHIDGNGLNNRFENLRVVSRAINSRNCKLSSRNKSGFCGVYQRKSGNWKSHIRVDRKLIYLGTFKSKEEAVKIRLLAEKKYGFTSLHGRR